MNNLLNIKNLIFIFRILLGILFLYSGTMKSLDPIAFDKIIKMYEILHLELIPYAAIFLPFIEIITGLFLIIGYKIKASSIILSIMMILFGIFIGINVYRGNYFECGCLELKKIGIGIDEDISIKLIFRNIILSGFLFTIFYREK
jgi:putative oxidoreductase